MLRVYTNGFYDILGFRFGKNLYGICIRTSFSSVFKKWGFIRVPWKHLPADAKPQWRRKMLERNEEQTVLNYTVYFADYYDIIKFVKVTKFAGSFWGHSCSRRSVQIAEDAEEFLRDVRKKLFPSREEAVKHLISQLDLEDKELMEKLARNKERRKRLEQVPND